MREKSIELSVEGYSYVFNEYFVADGYAEPSWIKDAEDCVIRMERTTEHQSGETDGPMLMSYNPLIYNSIGTYFKIEFSAKYKISGTLNVFAGLVIPVAAIHDKNLRSDFLKITGESSDESYHYLYFKAKMNNINTMYINMTDCEKGDWIEFTAPPSLTIVENERIIKQLCSK